MPINDKKQRKSSFKLCACGCGRKLDMVGGATRKYWYEHEKIGKGNFWFYFNHPPKCRCGCGEYTDWDDIRLMWRKFKLAHEKKLSEADKKRLLNKKRPSSNQTDLFSSKNGSIELNLM